MVQLGGVLLVTLVICDTRREEVTEVGVIELNHFYAGEKVQYSQIIFYEWNSEYRRYQVIKWEMFDDASGRFCRPYRNHEGYWETVKLVGIWEHRVYAKRFRLTHLTQRSSIGTSSSKSIVHVYSMTFADQDEPKRAGRESLEPGNSLRRVEGVLSIAWNETLAGSFAELRHCNGGVE